MGLIGISKTIRVMAWKVNNLKGGIPLAVWNIVSANSRGKKLFRYIKDGVVMDAGAPTHEYSEIDVLGVTHGKNDETEQEFASLKFRWIGESEVYDVPVFLIKELFVDIAGVMVFPLKRMGWDAKEQRIIRSGAALGAGVQAAEVVAA